MKVALPSPLGSLIAASASSTSCRLVTLPFDRRRLRFVIDCPCMEFPDLEVDCAKARGKIALTPAMAAPMAPDWRTTRRSLSITCPHVLASQVSRDTSLLQGFVLYGK